MLAAGILTPVDASAATRCETLAKAFTGGDSVATAREMDGACRLQAVTRPRPDSEIGISVWLPADRWNGRLLVLGNGGYSSALPEPAMNAYLKRGYVVAATDTGHKGDDPDFAAQRPTSIDDWARRSVHETAVRAKRVSSAFYGRPVSFAYFQGCSTGGHQAFMEAQRYPGDFDGIVAGAPGFNRTRLNAGFLWQFLQNHEADDPSRPIIPASKLALITKAALTQCGKANGGEGGGLPQDPYLNAPQACAFDPSPLRCVGEETDSCLTDKQLDRLRRMSAGARNADTGERIYFGWPPGSESPAGAYGGWSLYWANPVKPREPARASFWRIWAGLGDGWQPSLVNFAKDTDRADSRLASRINAMSVKLDAFRRRGGKMIHWHGGADPVVPVQDSIVYHDRLTSREARAGRDASVFYRFFMAPGVEHCQGGRGPAPLDIQASIEAWVERGQPPATLLATLAQGGSTGHGFARPLCPYPLVARFDGRNAPDAASSFACAPPAGSTKVVPPARKYLR
ncbi:DUF6351 family protein [Caulobacter sp.]|uniref:DUF6351 family protein n=1 Tax=Caulobacter sp. TaxID=78 RepID=UPI003BB0AB5E